MVLFAAVSLAAAVAEWIVAIKTPEELFYVLFGGVLACWAVAIVTLIFRGTRWPDLSFGDAQYLWLANAPG